MEIRLPIANVVHWHLRSFGHWGFRAYEQLDKPERAIRQFDLKFTAQYVYH